VISSETKSACNPPPRWTALTGRVAMPFRDLIRRIHHSTLARNAAWLFAGQGLSFLVQGIYFVVLARLLGTTEYGKLAGVVALVAVVSQYSTLGSGLLFLRYVSPDHSRFPAYWGNILMSIAVSGGLMVLGLRIAGSWLTGSQSISLLLPIAISDCLFLQFGSCAGQVFQTFEKMKFSAAITLTSNLLRMALAVSMLLAFRTATAWQWAVASLLISFTAAGFAFFTVTRNFGWPVFSPSLFFRRAYEGFVFAISGSTTAVYNDIDKVVLSHYGMNQANGIYSLAYRAINIGTMPVMSVVSAALPRFFRAGANGVGATLPMARQLLRRTALIGLGISAALFVLPPLVPYFAGHSYTESVYALRWLCLIPLLRCFHLSAGDAMAGAGHQKVRLISQSIAALGNLGLNLYLVPRYSWLGAAWASLATDAGLGVMNWFALLLLARRNAGLQMAPADLG
jgi:O-antigen/teichoic acid export membrane protein